MREPELEENALTAHVTEGRLSIVRRSIEAATAVSVTITDPDGKIQSSTLREVSPGRATLVLPVTTPGVWQVSDGTRSAYAAAGAANPPELSDLRATATVLNRVVRASGGSVHWLGRVGEPQIPELRRTEMGRAASGGSWVGLERKKDHVVTGVASLALLPAWASLPLMLALLVFAWRREGH